MPRAAEFFSLEVNFRLETMAAIYEGATKAIVCGVET